MKKKIIYIGNFGFPNKNAAGKRVYANGKLFERMGYEVVFIGKTSDDRKTVKKNTYEECTYFEIPIDKTNLREQIFSTKKIFDQIISCVNNYNLEEISYVVLYGEFSNYLLNKKIINFFKNKKIKIIVDCVEWWQETGTSLLFRSIKNFNTYMLMNYINPTSDGLITISEYLNDFYSSKGLKTVIIPPLSTTNIFHSGNKKGKKIKIYYAGVPFRVGIKNVPPEAMKDRLDLIIDLLNELKKTLNEIEFHIFGLTASNYIESVPRHKKVIDNSLDNWIFFHGIKSNEQILTEVKDFNFSILIRDEKLVTKAGFSTKLSESISLGKPVITNDVGDIKKYIVNGKTGIILDKELTSKNLNENVEKIANYLCSDFFNIEIIENESEFNIFYFENYVYEMNHFFKSL